MSIPYLGTNPTSPAFLNSSIEAIVTPPHNPWVMPKTYIRRRQDAELNATVYRWLNDDLGGFFMMAGESGTGRTTMMQKVLVGMRGVIYVPIDADALATAADDGGKALRDLIEGQVMKQLQEASTHPRRKRSLDGFLRYAQDVLRHKYPDSHLVIYITLHSNSKLLKYDAMVAIAESVGGLASYLSSKTNSAKTIVEFSNTAISDTINRLRSDFTIFQVSAMTEDEFMAIGKQIVNVEDPQNLKTPFLRHYHDWLGGQTKSLCRHGGAATADKIATATKANQHEVLMELKNKINAWFTDVTGALSPLQSLADNEKEFLVTLTKAGSAGMIVPRNRLLLWDSLCKRDSGATLIRMADDTNSRIHRFPHALFLNGVTGPDAKDAGHKIKDMKQTFGIAANTRSKDA